MPQNLTNSIHIDAPVGKVFAYVGDPSNFSRLMPGVTFSDVALTPDGVGTSYRFETRVAGLPIRGRGEYTEFTPDRHIHDDTTVASEGSFDWTFEAEGDGVRVTITHLPGRYWDCPSSVGSSPTTTSRWTSKYSSESSPCLRTTYPTSYARPSSSRRQLDHLPTRTRPPTTLGAASPTIPAAHPDHSCSARWS